MSAIVFNKLIYVTLVCGVLCFGWSMQDKIQIRVPLKIIQELHQHAEMCSKETGVPASYMRKMMESLLPNEDPVKKFLYCVSVNSGYADKDGHFVIEKMGTVQIMNGTADDFKDALTECNKVTLGRDIDTVYAMGACLHKNAVFTV